MAESEELEIRILAALRRIMRAVDLHSRQLVAKRGLTGPQLAVLREVGRLAPVTVGALARAIPLSQPTVSGILDRLEHRGLVRRERTGVDRRQVLAVPTPAGAAALNDAPPLLQDRFRTELARLPEWEQTAMLAMLQRIAAMMDAEALAAEPVLATEPIPGPSPTEEAAAGATPVTLARGDEPR